MAGRPALGAGASGSASKPAPSAARVGGGYPVMGLNRFAAPIVLAGSCAETHTVIAFDHAGEVRKTTK